jgi:hypothetical protein
MKTKEKNPISVNEQLREIRDAIGKEMAEMDPKQVIQHLKKKKPYTPHRFGIRKIKPFSLRICG